MRLTDFMILTLALSQISLSPSLFTGSLRNVKEFAEAYVENLARSESRAQVPFKFRMSVANNMLQAADKFALKSIPLREDVEYLYDYVREIDYLLELVEAEKLTEEEARELAIVKLKVVAKKDRIIARLTEFMRSEIRSAA